MWQKLNNRMGALKMKQHKYIICISIQHITLGSPLKRRTLENALDI